MFMCYWNEFDVKQSYDNGETICNQNLNLKTIKNSRPICVLHVLQKTSKSSKFDLQIAMNGARIFSQALISIYRTKFDLGYNF